MLKGKLGGEKLINNSNKYKKQIDEEDKYKIVVTEPEILNTISNQGNTLQTLQTEHTERGQGIMKPDQNVQPIKKKISFQNLGNKASIYIYIYN